MKLVARMSFGLGLVSLLNLPVGAEIQLEKSVIGSGGAQIGDDSAFDLAVRSVRM